MHPAHRDTLLLFEITTLSKVGPGMLVHTFCDQLVDRIDAGWRVGRAVLEDARIV